MQEIADYVGDSYYLAELATTVPQKTIIFCGVSFMGESAKILSPEKTAVSYTHLDVYKRQVLK